MVESISVTIAVAARQNLALRGQRNEKIDRSNISITNVNKDGELVISGDSNQGNLIALLRLGYTAGDENLKAIERTSVTYTSPQNQNGILSAIADEVRGSLIEDIGDGPFSVIADETTDVSTVEQLCITVRYVSQRDERPPTLEERFPKFRKMASVTGGIILDKKF